MNITKCMIDIGFLLVFYIGAYLVISEFKDRKKMYGSPWVKIKKTKGRVKTKEEWWDGSY